MGGFTVPVHAGRPQQRRQTPAETLRLSQARKESEVERGGAESEESVEQQRESD